MAGSCTAAGGAACQASVPAASLLGGGVTIPSLPVSGSITMTAMHRHGIGCPAMKITEIVCLRRDRIAPTKVYCCRDRQGTRALHHRGSSTPVRRFLRSGAIKGFPP